MRKLKDIVALVCLAVCLIGAIVLIIAVWKSPPSSPMVTNLLNIILFILSSLGAAITGYFTARITTSEKVDTIAEQSTEKMVHLSLQLQHLKDYLQETILVADEESGIHPAAGFNAYRHRVDAAADKAGSLAASNETFRNDWFGVVSATTRKTIEQKYESLREYLQDAETYNRLQEQRESGDVSGAEESELLQKLRAVEERIEVARKQLPVQHATSRGAPKAPAVSVRQNISDADDSIQKGTLEVEVLRPVFRATGSGRLAPQMRSVPQISVELKSHPAELDVANFRASPGTGTNFDFHVGLKSFAYGVNLPTGTYVFDYVAQINNHSKANNTLHDTAGGCAGAAPTGS